MSALDVDKLALLEHSLPPPRCTRSLPMSQPAAAAARVVGREVVGAALPVPAQSLSWSLELGFGMNAPADAGC